uniref:Uncharacterized protein n=1 Tax=Timema shepardi TaxID=629360 RepID=A0A7R9FX52_TIMSH|nr:unnamed protein product [Timema shepardi]
MTLRRILLLLFFLYFNAHAHIYSAVIGSPYKRVRRKLKLGNFYGVRTLWPEQSDIVASISYGPRTYGYGIHQHMSVEDLRSVFQVDHHEKDYSNIIVDVRILFWLNIDSHSPFTQSLLTNSTVRSAYKAIVSTNQGSGCFQTRVNETSSLTSRCHLGLPDNKVPTYLNPNLPFNGELDKTSHAAGVMGNEERNQEVLVFNLRLSTEITVQDYKE